MPDHECPSSNAEEPKPTDDLALLAALQRIRSVTGKILAERALSQVLGLTAGATILVGGVSALVGADFLDALLPQVATLLLFALSLRATSKLVRQGRPRGALGVRHTIEFLFASSALAVYSHEVHEIVAEHVVAVLFGIEHWSLDERWREALHALHEWSLVASFFWLGMWLAEVWRPADAPRPGETTAEADGDGLGKVLEDISRRFHDVSVALARAVELLFASLADIVTPPKNAAPKDVAPSGAATPTTSGSSPNTPTTPGNAGRQVGAVVVVARVVIAAVQLTALDGIVSRPLAMLIVFALLVMLLVQPGDGAHRANLGHLLLILVAIAVSALLTAAGVLLIAQRQPSPDVPALQNRLDGIEAAVAADNYAALAKASEVLDKADLLVAAERVEGILSAPLRGIPRNPGYGSMCHALEGSRDDWRRRLTVLTPPDTPCAPLVPVGVGDDEMPTAKLMQRARDRQHCLESRRIDPRVVTDAVRAFNVKIALISDRHDSWRRGLRITELAPGATEAKIATVEPGRDVVHRLFPSTDLTALVAVIAFVLDLGTVLAMRHVARLS